MGMVINSFSSAVAGGTLVYQETEAKTISGGTETYSNKAIGTAAADRLVIVAIMARRSSVTPRTITGVTIGGNAATVVSTTRTGGASGGLTVGIAYLVVTTGTTASVVVTFSGALTENVISVYTCTGLTSTTPTDTETQNTGSDPSGTIDVSNQGIIVGAFAGCEGSLGDITLTGVTEDYDATTSSLRAASGKASSLSAQTGRTISMAASTTSEAFVAASWA